MDDEVRSERKTGLGDKVGLGGEVVIAKDIRDRLGVKPGWRALQRLTGDHLEIYFLPPEHTRSLAGSLKSFIKRAAPTEEALQEAREAARGQTRG